MNSEEQTILNLEQKKEVATFAKEQFAFLKAAKGFTRPLVNQPSNGLLIYRNAMMGIGIEMSFSFPGYYYDNMKVTIGKLGSDGNYPKFPYMNEAGVRSYWVLQSLLTRQLHVQDEQIPALDQLFQDLRGNNHVWTVEQWKEAISSYQPLLQKYIDLILQQPSEVLFPTALEYLPVGLEEFAQLAREHFAFLQQYGFRPDPLVGYYGSHTWINADRGITLNQDFRDRDIYCSVVKLIDGKLPTDDKRELKHDGFIQGRRIMIPLYNLLTRQLGITDAEIETVRNSYTLLPIRDYSDYDYTYASTVIRMYANLVRCYISQLMSAPL